MPVVSWDNGVGSSQIINCYSDATLTAKNNAGGIVGRIGEGKVDSCIIDNCVSISTLTTTKSNKAGISSENSSGSIVRNCFYANTLPSAISSDKGKSENISSLAPEAFAGDSIVAVLNTNAENIPGACRWIRSSMCPALDYRIFTIDGDEVDISAMATSPIPPMETCTPTAIRVLFSCNGMPPSTVRRQNSISISVPIKTAYLRLLPTMLSH